MTHGGLKTALSTFPHTTECALIPRPRLAVLVFLLVLLAAARYPAAEPPERPAPSGLVSWWRGEGNCRDAQGGNNGTLENGATFAPGRVGQAFSFDGVKSYTKIPRAASLDPGDQVTIDCWVRAETNNAIGSRIEGLVVSDFYGLEIGGPLNPGVIFFISTNSGSTWTLTWDSNRQGAVFRSGEWHHLAGTYDGAKLQLYVDGQPWGVPTPATGRISPMLRGSRHFEMSLGGNRLQLDVGGQPSRRATPAARRISPLAGGSFVAIGSEDGKTSVPNCIGTRYFAGQMDEVDIFNRALSAGEIAAIYNAGAAGKRLTPGMPPWVAWATLVGILLLLLIGASQLRAARRRKSDAPASCAVQTLRASGRASRRVVIL